MEDILRRLRGVEIVTNNGIFSVQKGERVFFGADPGSVHAGSRNEKLIQIKGFPKESLSPCVLEISLNDEGNPRIWRFPSKERQPIVVWGQDKKEGSIWKNWPLIQELPEKVYERIDGGSVIVDIQIKHQEEKTTIRLNDAGRKDQEARSFRVEINPKKLNLSQ